MARIGLCPALAVAVVALAGGCAKQSELIPVTGKVTLEGKPLVHGTVSYRPPAGDLTAPQASGPLDAEGNYRLFTEGEPGVKPGTYRVVVFAYDQPTRGPGHRGLPQSIIHVRYQREDTTPLMREVGKDVRAGAYDLELEP
jgi:hypothetical protein